MNIPFYSLVVVPCLRFCTSNAGGLGLISDQGRYIYLNAEFQNISRRDKKVFLSYQCKEIEENNRMEKTTDLFKKIFHAKMGTIKDINGMDLNRSRRY